jgi:hypothetical protein
MPEMQLSPKGMQLVNMYEEMAQTGYNTNAGTPVNEAYNSFELKKIKRNIKEMFGTNNVQSVLDYGCGGSNWLAPGFDNEKSAVDYFNLDSVYRYEPARKVDERQLVDCVVCFDVMEHIFVSDVSQILRDIFSYAKNLIILNIACYEANALLPNGENAHVTVRNPHWWKGAVDVIATEYPSVSVQLICSPRYDQMLAFPGFSDSKRQQDDNFCISY